MEKETPQNQEFENSRKLSFLEDVLEAVLFVYAAIATFKFTDCILFSEKFILIISAVGIVFKMFVYIYRVKYFNGANNKKIDYFVSNIFNINLQLPEIKASGEFYNNDEITDIELRNLANLHENVYFTRGILDKSYLGRITFGAILLTISFVIILYNGIDSTSYILLEFIISANFIQKGLTKRSLKADCDNLFDNINNLCLEYEKEKKNNNFRADVLKYTIIYENITYEAKIVLSKKRFDKLNPLLTKKWEDIKAHFTIYQ